MSGEERTVATRPWYDLYPSTVDPDLVPPVATMLAAWDATVDDLPDAPCVHYFDRTLTFAEVDAAAASLAAGLVAGGTAVGDRLGVYLQNDPQWLVALVGAWKAGVIPVAVNPMLKGRELIHHLTDAGCSVLLCLEQLYRDVVTDVLDQLPVRWVITTHPADLTPGVKVPAQLADAIGDRQPPEPTTALADLLLEHRDPPLQVHVPAAEDIAVLTYTSGTTGASKGAMNVHRGMVHSSQVFVDWFDLDEQDVVLGMAPLFHITGIVAGMGATIVSGAPLVLGHRFDAEEVLTALEQRGATFTIGTVTAYIALATHGSLPDRDVSSLTKAGSGGAGISPAAVERIHRLMGVRIAPVYGLTETTSPTHASPPGVDPPTDPGSGALAVGIPVPGAEVRIVDIDSGQDVEPGGAGEVAIRGPMVVPGYWEQPEETASAIRDWWLFTGDVGVEDAQGWLFIVDRKKDLINAGGYKIWPREVEDVLYQHPAVREAAVVGVDDEYRGETVKAVVSLLPGEAASEDELIAHCRDNMAAYKYPRILEIRDELPKTVSGKLLRRELR